MMARLEATETLFPRSVTVYEILFPKLCVQFRAWTFWSSARLVLSTILVYLERDQGTPSDLFLFSSIPFTFFAQVWQGLDLAHLDQKYWLVYLSHQTQYRRLVRPTNLYSRWHALSQMLVIFIRCWCRTSSWHHTMSRSLLTVVFRAVYGLKLSSLLLQSVKDAYLTLVWLFERVKSMLLPSVGQSEANSSHSPAKFQTFTAVWCSLVFTVTSAVLLAL